MKAIIYHESHPIDHPEALIDTELPKPEAGPLDVIVEIEAISVNPVDTKIRRWVQPQGHRVLGWDAVGTVIAKGAHVTKFNEGDRVWYAGELDKPGTNSQQHKVDSRIISHAPRTLNSAQAAAMPLTTITAWELLFEKLKIPQKPHTTDAVVLVSGAAGGVGSILLQLAAKLTDATIIATAGSTTSTQWVTQMGADHVINYRTPLEPQIKALGFEHVTHVISLTHTADYLAQFAEIIKPFGHLALIDDPDNLEVKTLKRRSISLHWEFMFTRSMYQTEDIGQQGQLLQTVADLMDNGTLQTTLQQTLSPINANTLKQAHRLIEQSAVRGKLAIVGFPE